MPTTHSPDVFMPDSPPPPADLGTYSRVMQQHTKRQMEAASRSSRRRNASAEAAMAISPMPDGVASTGRPGRMRS